MYRVARTSAFERQLARFMRWPELNDRVAEALQLLADDPFEPQLRLHALRGNLEGLYAIRLTYQYQITLTLVAAERKITLHDIGAHEEAYR